MPSSGISPNMIDPTRGCRHARILIAAKSAFAVLFAVVSPKTGLSLCAAMAPASTIERPVRALFLVAAIVLGIPLLAAGQNPIQWSVAHTEKDTIHPGQTFDVELTADIDPTWHLYALNQPPGGPLPLAIGVAGGRTFNLAGEVGSWVPKSAIDPNFNLETLFYEERASFTVPIEVTPAAKDGIHKLGITITYQTCNDHLCLPPKAEDLALNIYVGTPPAGTPAVSSIIDPEMTRAAPGTAVARVPDMAAASASASTLWRYLSLAVMMGALSLLTPCVFPMIPITVSYFTNRANQSRRQAVSQALVYGAGIILTFTAVGFAIAIAFGASGVNRFAANPWLNLGIMTLFVVFSLSLFGAYDLTLPSRLVTRAAGADSGRGRHVGTLLMGLAFTLTSFTCTVPFLGALLVVAAQGDWQWPLAGMLAFSTVFAVPFVILAMAPGLLSTLPRSGVWLIGVKAAMGLLELAAAMKFLSNADLVWGWGIFTRPVVLLSWIAVAGVLAVYLSGFLGLGPAPRLGRPGRGRFLAGAACVVLGVWLATGLSGRRLGELEAFLPPANAHGVAGGELTWLLNDYEAALAEAKRQDRPLLVDFTGYTCTNCRWMEANMFPKPEVRTALAEYIRVRLYTDGRGELYQRFQQMEQQLFGTVALPFYAVFTPAGEPVVSFGGLTRDSNEYLRFLKKGLE
jgi:thiol:disulfide interchange protein